MIEIKCLRLTLAQPRVASSSATTKGQSDVMSVGTCALSIAPGSSFDVSCLSQFVVAAFRTGLACGRRWTNQRLVALTGCGKIRPTKEGVDDWDQVPSFVAGEAPRRSTSSLDAT
jgi:hypothetical protein